MIFKTTQSDLLYLNDTKVKVIRTISEPDIEHDIDSLPMFVLDIKHNGKNVEAWKDELIEEIENAGLTL